MKKKRWELVIRDKEHRAVAWFVFEWKIGNNLRLGSRALAKAQPPWLCASFGLWVIRDAGD